MCGCLRCCCCRVIRGFTLKTHKNKRFIVTHTRFYYDHIRFWIERTIENPLRKNTRTCHSTFNHLYVFIYIQTKQQRNCVIAMMSSSIRFSQHPASWRGRHTRINQRLNCLHLNYNQPNLFVRFARSLACILSDVKFQVKAIK